MEHELTKEQLSIQEIDNLIDSGLDAVATLKAYGDLLKQSGTDGISRQSAAILNVGLSNCYKVLGLESQSTGLESYTTCTSRDGLLKAEISFESITEKIKAGAKRVWEWILKMLESIKKFYGRIGDATVKVKEQINKLFDNFKKPKKAPNENKEDQELKAGEYEISKSVAAELSAFIKNDKLIADNTNEAYRMLLKFSDELPRVVIDYHKHNINLIVYNYDAKIATNLEDEMEKNASQVNRVLSFAKINIPNFCKFNYGGFKDGEHKFEFENYIPSPSEKNIFILKARTQQEIGRDLEEIRESNESLRKLSNSLKNNSIAIISFIKNLRDSDLENRNELIAAIKSELSLFKSTELTNFISFYLRHNTNKISAIYAEQDALV